ncbi:unnamed protein product [Phyllotreta striolata]|uniref:Serine/threonine-protein kinase ATM n=1 Tax=Phyllotreta striolata TaxID=444603 RepID=A0A9N9XJT2_PHYSR|nr:unnamed protein product [Phyllotreta striolata]
MDKQQLEQCVTNIESDKVTIRRKYCTLLSELLDTNIVDSLEENICRRLISSLQWAIKKDVNLAQKSSAAEQLVKIITLSLKKDIDINLRNLVGYVVGCMQEAQMKACYQTQFLEIIQKNFISQPKVMGQLKREDWTEIYGVIKSLINEDIRQSLLLQCLDNLINWGPSYGMSPNLLREDFQFITNFCLEATCDSRQNIQMKTIQIAIHFCEQTIKDNRVSCCKFGEDVITSFGKMYYTSKGPSLTKRLLVEFFLLQIVIHHPRGVFPNNPAAYACNWNLWRNFQKSLLSWLIKDIEWDSKQFKQGMSNSLLEKDDETSVFCNNFTKLFVEVSWQLLMDPNVNQSVRPESPPTKKLKMEYSFANYLDSLRKTKSWLWLHVITSLIKTYPGLIEVGDYTALLEILSAFQVNCNQHNVVEKTYVCLFEMIRIETTLDIKQHEEAITKLWKLIGINSVRAFGLDQHKKPAEKLIERLVSKGIVDFEDLLQTYQSGVSSLTISSIACFNTGLKFTALNELNKKECIMRCILPRNCKSYEHLLDKETARLLVKLVFSEFQCENVESPEPFQSNDIYSNIIDIYSKTSYLHNEEVSSVNRKEHSPSVTPDVHDGSISLLTTVVTEFVGNSTDCEQNKEEILFYKAALLSNLCHWLREYNVREISNCPFMNLLEDIWKNDLIMEFRLCSYIDGKSGKKLLNCLGIVEELFSLDVAEPVMDKLKEFVPMKFLKSLVECLNGLQMEGSSKFNAAFELKKSIVKVLTSYACVCGKNLNERQSRVLLNLSNPSYDFSIDQEYELLKTFLDSLKSSNLKTFPDAILNNINACIKELAQVRYKDEAEGILDILSGMLPFISSSADVEIKSLSVCFLKPFHDNLDHYGPNVSLLLLECCRILCELDAQNDFSRWSGKEIIKFVPDFLTSDYQEVRFKAIDVFVAYFRANYGCTQLSGIHTQEEVFNQIYEKSLLNLEVTGSYTNQREMDETLCRTASVLLTFVNIVNNCDNWIEESLYSLIKISHVKNIENIKEALRIINKSKFGNVDSSILEKYLLHIMKKWFEDGYSFDEFPFNLLNCTDKFDFYRKHFDDYGYLIVLKAPDDLSSLANILTFTQEEIVEKTSAKILSHLICSDRDNCPKDSLSNNKIFASYIEIVGAERLKQILNENLQDIVMEILNHLNDDQYISNTLRETVIFFNKRLTTSEVSQRFVFVEKFVCAKPLGSALIERPSQLENILLRSKEQLMRASLAKDRLKYLHRYTFFVGFVVEFLDTKDDCGRFFIRDVLHTLTNSIRNGADGDGVATASCTFLSIFLRAILPRLSLAFKPFFSDTVSAINQFYLTRKSVSSTCKEILHRLLIDNSTEFGEDIAKLDAFPEFVDEKQDRRDAKRPQLSEEILRFLDGRDASEKEDGLVDLRRALADRKEELMALYDKLDETRGFSEDCENSPLHRLICALARLCQSDKKRVVIEAARCLGELGPTNLHTVVLQPEKYTIHREYSPLQILIGNVISMLSEYIVDCDINVIKAASKLLYSVLATKEASAVLGTDDDFGCGPIVNDYIQPYVPCNKPSQSQNLSVNANLFLTNLQDDELWCPNSCVSHENWIVKLFTNILNTFSESSILPKLIDICKIKVEFSERLFPIVTVILLVKGHKKVAELISKKIDYFFSQHWKITKESDGRRCIATNKKSVKFMLDLVQFVRLMKKSNLYTIKYNVQLNVNNLYVAKAAAFCANHFSALYFAELFCQENVEKIEDEDPVHCEKRSTMIDAIYKNMNPELAEGLYNILRNAYKAVGDFDALSGCGDSFLLHPKYRIEHYKEQGKYDQVVQYYSNQPAHNDELMASLKALEIYKVPALYASSAPDYECLWRLGRWSFEEASSFDDYEKHRFSALKALRNNNAYSLEKSSEAQFLCVANRLKTVSLESSHNLYPALSKLQALVELEDLSKAASVDGLIEKWRSQDGFARKSDFKYVEPIVAHRLIMLTDCLNGAQRSDVVRNYVADLYLAFADFAREEGFDKKGLMILDNLKRIPGLSSDVLVKINLLDAQLCWSVGNTVVAKQILKELCHISKTSDPKLYSQALKLTGYYMSETRSENSNTIISEYFEKSITIMAKKEVEKNGADIQIMLDSFDKLAVFADKEYQQIMTYIKSDVFQKKIDHMEETKKTAADLLNQRNKSVLEKRAAIIHDRNSSIDDAEIKAAYHESNNFLKIALKYYSLCLTHGNVKNERIFQLIALFLTNRKNEEIADTIEKYFLKIPSYKFIVTLPQLVPHLADEEVDLFGKKVTEVLRACALDHPYHTLPLLLAITNAHKDRDYLDGKVKTVTNDLRTIKAQQLLALLKRKGLKDLINRTDSMSQALIDLAYLKCPDEYPEEKDYPISKQKILSIKQFDDVLVPTCELPISISKDYTKIIGISHFKPSYRIVGGVNQPKKIICVGTNGLFYSQLIKGHDDLRQDAVMQQVFNIMNNLLSYNKSTKHLRIRTYKIVPLSMRSGILKWADNSMPIGEYLVGTSRNKIKGAHEIYRPTDKSPNYVKNVFKNVAQKSAEHKLKTYKDICRNFRPVFHHFFENFFLQPAVWYERRRAYIHSVATTSICGYVLGIGDRHNSNILIDKTTAEVIHIDFGVAFEQGRVLPTPETVPFRLTRDIVDGMGASGVEGIFRRSCEKTMEVLRQNGQTINTILEVLLYDPLYVWTITNAEANKRQIDGGSAVTGKAESSGSSEEPKNVSAKRALLRLREKLQGTELGYPRSIEHQVEALIQQAVDPTNLCKLFVGWQPYL